MRRAERGFTLMELLVAVVIVGILAMIAVPSYRAYVLRSHRTAAESFIMKIASLEEAFYADRLQYATTLVTLQPGYTDPQYIGTDGAELPGSAGASYSVSLTGASATAFTVQAVPQGSQADDTRCGTLTLTSAGVKGASGGGTDCWRR